jgi:hypothetical protein
MDASERRAGSLALMALGAVAVLACVSAIGAATTLIVMAVDESEPAVAMATYDEGCAVVAWNSGTTHCFRSLADGANRPARSGPAVVIQAQADSAR